MAWRTCFALDTLRAEVNAAHPGRSKASDGTIGDAAHASRSSDHNPWITVGGRGVVRAWDVTRAGLDLPALFERLRRMGAAGDPRLAGGGYLILDRRITTPNFSGWKNYTGSNPHTKHGHISFSRNQAGFDSRAPWGIAGGSPVPTAGGVLRRGASGPAVRAWQEHCNRMYARFRPPLTVDGDFGPATEARTKDIQAFRGVDADGEVGPATRAATNFRG